MTGACGDLGDICPVANITLPVVVPSHGDHGAVGLKPHRVPEACGDLGDIRPIADIALPVAVLSCSDHGAVGLKPHRVPEACGDHGRHLPLSHNRSRIQYRSRKNQAEDQSDREQSW